MPTLAPELQEYRPGSQHFEGGMGGEGLGTSVGCGVRGSTGLTPSV